MTMENGGTIDFVLPNLNVETNISDVIEVIQDDPQYLSEPQPTEAAMFTGGGIQGHGANPNIPAPGASSLKKKSNSSIYVRIVEQPAPKALRFRYECEGRSAGSIPGARSTPENKTYPTIEIVGCKTRAVCVVSCVTKDIPHKAHPHNLVGKDCKKGVCTVEINSESMCYSFSNLGIQCVKKKDIEDALRVREEIKVDPYKGGFAHRSQPAGIDLNAVRLCFQVFLEGQDRKFNLALAPVVSEIIYDKKAMSDLVICKMSHCTASVAGGQEVILLCEKVAKEDINIRFFEEMDGQIVWEDNGDFQHANVHKQVAIAFRTPKYRTINVKQPVKVFIQLRRPSDNATSEALPFELLPLNSDKTGKRPRLNSKEDSNITLERLKPPNHDIASMDPLAQPQIYHSFAVGLDPRIKMEPGDQPRSPYEHFASSYRTMQNSPSPQHNMATPSPPLEYPWHHYQHIIPHHLSPIPNPPPQGAQHHVIHGPPYQNPEPSYSNTPGPSQQNIPVPVTAPPLPENPSFPYFPLNIDGFPSGDLTGLSGLLDGTNPSTNNANFRHESDMNIDQENVTNSFTRLTTSVLNELTAAPAPNISDQYGHY